MICDDDLNALPNPTIHFLDTVFAQYTKLYESIENNLFDKEVTILIRNTCLFVAFFAFREHRNHGKSVKRLGIGFEVPRRQAAIHHWLCPYPVPIYWS